MSEDKLTPAVLATWSGVVARSWSDPQYKAALLENPNQVLAEAGLPVGRGVTYVVVENTPGVEHLVLPERPDRDVEVSELLVRDFFSPGY